MAKSILGGLDTGPVLSGVWQEKEIRSIKNKTKDPQQRTIPELIMEQVLKAKSMKIARRSPNLSKPNVNSESVLKAACIPLQIFVIFIGTPDTVQNLFCE